MGSRRHVDVSPSPASPSHMRISFSTTASSPLKTQYTSNGWSMCQRPWRRWNKGMGGTKLMEQQMKSEGVNYYGMVSHASLAHLLSQSGFCEKLLRCLAAVSSPLSQDLYPTAFPETSCIALMKAQVRALPSRLGPRALNVYPARSPVPFQSPVASMALLSPRQQGYSTWGSIPWVRSTAQAASP
eukprot:760341-Hanusia_phi.AAC.3